MRANRFARSVVLAMVWLILLPAGALAQSAISGLVTDTTGAILPGVTVEAASPALIEKVRTAVTDAQGRYSIVNLRPGVYSVTFTLTGFSTLKREGIDLPANFTAAVNVELKVGALEETVIVTSQAPVVDVQATARTQVLPRSVLDSIPTARTTQSIGAVISGVKITVPDVGGSRSMENTSMVSHGTVSLENTIQIDGMIVNAQLFDGSVQAYHNDGMSQEFSYQTSSVLAEVSAGGVRLNMIPQQGGNTFTGATFIGGTDGSWQSSKITPALRARGLRTPDAVTHIYDVNLSLGGPIRRNKLWFYGSFRRNSADVKVANSFYADGKPGIQDQYIMNLTGRLTLQASSKDKITVYLDRAFKFKGHDFTAGVDPATAAVRRDPMHANYNIHQVKWTSTISNRILLETGYSSNIENHTHTYQDGVRKPLGSPAWYASASRVDLIRQTRTTASSFEDYFQPDRYVVSSMLSYVTGSHTFKTGFQWSFGPSNFDNKANADLVQNYRDGVPDSVDVYNTPVLSKMSVKADRGIFAQDSWTTRRLTVNAGVRFEHFNSEIREQNAPPGRFVPFRHFDRVPDLPNWNDVAPRFGVVYDVFGDAKTAVKVGVNKYMRPWVERFANRYNPMYFATDRRNWNDCAYLPGTSTCDPALVGAPGWHDDIAQDNEIGRSNNLKFGTAPSRHPASDLQREYNVEYTASLQHEILRGVSLTGAWYRRRFYNLERQKNLLVSFSDYTPFQAANPLNSGEVITIYNLNLTKQGQVDILDETSSLNKRTYNGFEASFMARLPKGGTAFGGWTIEHTITVSCDVPDPNQRRFCDQSGKLYQELGQSAKIPFRSEFKLAGSYPLPKGFSASMSLLSYAGNAFNAAQTEPSLRVDWVVPASAFPNGQRTQQVTVPLIPPGTKFLNRWNQLDIGTKKAFRIGRIEMIGGATVFNALNSRVVLTQNQTSGSALDQPQSVLQGRLLRLESQMKF